MKFSCEKYLLLNAVTTSSRAAAVKSAVAALEGLLLECRGNTVTISGYDLKTGIVSSFPADVISEGSIVLNARLFGEIVRKLPEEPVLVSSAENLLTTISAGASQFDIMGSQAEDYPELPVSENEQVIAVKQGVLKGMITQTNFAVSDNEARPIHTGTLFETENGILTMVAVDGYRLALRREETEDSPSESQSFVVPGTALSEVEKILSDSEETVDICLGSKHITFKFGDTVLISRRLEGEFLNYRKSVPVSGKYDLIANRKDILTALDRVSLIISDKLKSPVRCTFSDGMVSFLSMTPIGRASDECAVVGDGEGLIIGFNNRYLMDALKAAPAEEVLIRLTSGVSPCLILPTDGSDRFLYMVLPVRLKNEA